MVFPWIKINPAATKQDLHQTNPRLMHFALGSLLLLLLIARLFANFRPRLAPFLIVPPYTTPIKVSHKLLL